MLDKWVHIEEAAVARQSYRGPERRRNDRRTADMASIAPFLGFILDEERRFHDRRRPPLSI